MGITEQRADTYQLLRLMTLLSPVFPVGAFSYSHGLEQAIHAGFITCRADMEEWLRGLLQKGTARNDVIFLAEAWRLGKSGDAWDERMDRLAQLACAMAGSRERKMETLLQGGAFLQAAAEYENTTAMDRENITYPVAVGIITAGMGLGLKMAATAYLHAFISNLVQVALRLVPLGQRDGVRLLHTLEGDVLALSKQAPQLTCNDLGTAALMSDICAMRHETLYSRIFRS